MSNRSCLSWVLLSALVITAQLRAADAPTDEDVRKTIDRSLPYLEKAGVDWIEKKKCITCHRIAFFTWSLSLADKKGIAVDREKWKGWIEWSVTSSVTNPQGLSIEEAKNPEGFAQLILGRGAGSPADLTKEQTDQLVKLLVKSQQADGSWKPAGQLPGQKRPMEETTQVSTMWVALALGQLPADEATREVIAKAWKRVENAEPGKSAEWYAVKILGYQQQGDEAKLKQTIEQLKSHQQEDGGWGWLLKDKSDALATGQAIYALSVAGVPKNDPALERALKFLVSTQRDDGSWEVKGTKEGKKNNVEETSVYWGSAWATMALLQTLP